MAKGAISRKILDLAHQRNVDLHSTIFFAGRYRRST
jgi:hypothetical protein